VLLLHSCRLHATACLKTLVAQGGGRASCHVTWPLLRRARPQILLQRKLLLLPSKIAVHPSSVISLAELTPRFDERTNAIHLTVSGARA
jgi:hypothetical protein